MNLEGMIHCEGPDCNVHEHVGPDTMIFDRLPSGWLKVIEHGNNVDLEEAFCSWNCLMKRAASIEPPTEISLDDD